MKYSFPPAAATAIWCYLRAALFLFPLLVAAAFSRVFLIPKLREVWAMAGIDHPNANALLAVADTFAQHFWLLAPLLVPLLIGLEFLLPGWKRVRGPAMDLVVFIAIWLALAGVLAVATSALLAVPMVLP